MQWQSIDHCLTAMKSIKWGQWTMSKLRHLKAENEAIPETQDWNYKLRACGKCHPSTWEAQKVAQEVQSHPKILSEVLSHNLKFKFKVWGYYSSSYEVTFLVFCLFFAFVPLTCFSVKTYIVCFPRSFSTIVLATYRLLCWLVPVLLRAYGLWLLI